MVFSEGAKPRTGRSSPPASRTTAPPTAQSTRNAEKAFRKLSELKELAIPFLVEHLKDNRQSIPFRNHFLGHSVGTACYWNIYFQLQDRPDDYSSYGLSREGRDGQDHNKPYWTGTPFDNAGGLVKWLEANKRLSYTEKQIKCLKWLLDKEKAIGAPDAESYFRNILPLEMQILKHGWSRARTVQKELSRLRKVKAEKQVESNSRGTPAGQASGRSGHERGPPLAGLTIRPRCCPWKEGRGGGGAKRDAS